MPRVPASLQELTWEYAVHFTQDELVTLDLDWFASDEEGHIARFTTAGRGPIPADLRKADVKRLTMYFRKEALNRCDAIESEGWEQYEYGELPRQKKNLEDYLAMAKRGLFVFDAPADYRVPLVYYRLAIPSSPLRVCDLPSEIGSLVTGTKLAGILFRSTVRIMPEQLGRYISGDSYPGSTES